MNIAAIILAAGNSSRLGQPKQLVMHDGESLVRHAVRAATEVECNPILVVVGAQAEKVRAELEGLDLGLVKNNDWTEGIASSIRAGIDHLIETAPQIEAVFLLACDQPFVNGTLLKQLMDLRLTTGKQIVASAYAHTFGIPALFDRNCFAELLGLKGDYGAKQLMIAHFNDMPSIDFPAAAIDIDTPADFQHL